MDALILVLISGVCLVLAYLTYGRWLSRRVFVLRDDAVTPAHELEDGTDFVPTKKSIVFGHHFTSIAGTGPIVGPAIAVMWGWLPAILWVVLGSIFVGAVHDLGALVVSLRNKGRSIGDIAGDLLGPRARFIFLFILIMGLWLVLAIFGLVIAAVLRQYPSAITPVLIQVPVAVVIGLLIHRTGRSIVLPSIAALGIMYASVIWGDVGFLHEVNTALAALPTWVWVGALLVYAYIASVLPVWTLLQPRDYINALQLITTLGVLVVGLVVASIFGGAPDGVPVIDAASLSSPEVISSPPPSGRGQGEGSSRAVGTPSPDSLVNSSESPSPTSGGEGGEKGTRPELRIVAPMLNWQPVGAPPMLPLLFITIACGACSGFHSLVGSGTTSKQLRKETDATAVGYGSMLVEGFLATLVIAACVAGLGLGATEALPIKYANSMLSKNLLMTDATIGQESRFDAQPMESFTLAVTRTYESSGNSTKVEFYPRDARLLSFGGGGDRHSFEFTVGDGAIQPLFALEGERVLSWLRLPSGDVRVVPVDDDISLALTTRGPLAFDTTYASWQEAGSLGAKVGAFVQGAANLIASLGIPHSTALAIMAVLVASFAGTTMDTACRLQRYVIQELSATFLPKRKATDCVTCGYDMSAHAPPPSGRGQGEGSSRAVGTPSPDSLVNSSESPSPTPGGDGGEGGNSARCPECGTLFDADNTSVGVTPLSASAFNPFRWLHNTHGATLFAVLSAFALAAVPPAGQPWSLANAGSGGLILWPLFGATNQLLGGFAFIVITAWLLVRRKPIWFIVIPALFMLAVPASAMVWQAFIGNADNPSWFSQSNWLLVSIACATLALEAWLIIETLAHWALKRPFDAMHKETEQL